MMSVKIDSFSLERLMKGHAWTFGNMSTGEVFAQALVPASGGRIQGYTHPNESAWRVKGGAVEFLAQNGAVSARFENIRQVDGHY
jgi:hypothetical protein